MGATGDTSPDGPDHMVQNPPSLADHALHDARIEPPTEGRRLPPDQSFGLGLRELNGFAGIVLAKGKQDRPAVPPLIAPAQQQ